MRYSIQKMTISGFTHYEIIDTENNCETVAAVKNYVAAYNLCDQLNCSTEKTYATTTWSWEDVAGMKPDWTEEQCRQWWENNEKWFKDVLTEYGNEILSNIPG